MPYLRLLTDQVSTTPRPQAVAPMNPAMSCHCQSAGFHVPRMAVIWSLSVMLMIAVSRACLQRPARGIQCQAGGYDEGMDIWDRIRYARDRALQAEEVERQRLA